MHKEPQSLTKTNNKKQKLCKKLSGYHKQANDLSGSSDNILGVLISCQ